MRMPNGYWNYETCYSAAKSCNSISEFTKLYSGALDKAMDNGWMKDFIWIKNNGQFELF